MPTHMVSYHQQVLDQHLSFYHGQTYLLSPIDIVIIDADSLIHALLISHIDLLMYNLMLFDDIPIISGKNVKRFQIIRVMQSWWTDHHINRRWM
jgi:hypothetical protein